MADDLTLTAILKADASNMASGFKQASQAMGGFKNAASATSGGIKEIESAAGGAGVLGTVAVAVAAIGVAAVGVGVKATKMAADYQQAMLKVQALTGASTDQMKQFDSGLKSLATETGKAPKELAGGLYNVISAGYKGADAMTVLSLATKDSVIGMTDAKVTTDALTNVLASFGLGAKDAQRVNGEMLETVTLGKSTFEQYASTIVKSASAANQFHVSMETMNAAFATMTSSGIKAAQASTDFQQSLKVMYGNIGAVTKSLQSNNIAFDEAKFNTLDYGGKVQMLNKVLEEANAKHVKVTGVTLQAAQAINTIATHMDAYNSDLKTLSDRQAMAAKTQEAWAITQQGFNVSMDRLKATMQVFMIDIGQKLLPIATGGVNLLSNAFQGLMDTAGQVGASFNAFMASLDHVGIKGAIANFEYLGKQLGDVFNTIVTFGTYAFEQLMPPMTTTSDLAATVSTDIRKLGDWFWDTGVKVKKFENALLGQGPAVENMVSGIKQASSGFLSLGKTLATTVIPAFIQIHNVFTDVILHALGKLTPILAQIVPPLIQFGNILAKNIAGALQFLTPYIVQAATAVGKFANEIIDRLQPIILSTIEGLKPAIQSFARFWSLIWGGISQYLKGTWEVIAGVVKVAWSVVSGIIKIGLDLLTFNWSQAWTDLKDMLGGIWSGIKDMIHGGIDQVAGLLDAVWSVLSGKISAPFERAWDVIKPIFDSIKAAINWVTGQGNNVSLSASATLTGPHHFASGVENFKGGLAIVGEQGPELVSLPRGSSVFSASKTSALMNTAKSTFQYPTSSSGSIGGGGSVVHVHVHPVIQPNDLYLDGHKLTNGIAPHLAGMIRMKGDVRAR